jgi:hypothetical protein
MTVREAWRRMLDADQAAFAARAALSEQERRRATRVVLEEEVAASRARAEFNRALASAFR